MPPLSYPEERWLGHPTPDRFRASVNSCPTGHDRENKRPALVADRVARRLADIRHRRAPVRCDAVACRGDRRRRAGHAMDLLPRGAPSLRVEERDDLGALALAADAQQLARLDPC